MDIKSVLVTDGYWRKTLAVVRALSKMGVKVSVGERTPLATALFSRYAAHRYVYPSVTEAPDEFLNWLKHKLMVEQFDVLLIPEEETSLLVARHKDTLEKYTAIPLADHDKISFVRNKFKLISYARELGIPCPETQLISSISQARKIAPSLTYPVVLKPVFGTGARGVCYINDAESFKVSVVEMLERFETCLVQDFIPGCQYYGASVLFNKENQMRAAFVHKKIRQYPVTGGSSTYAVSVKNPALVSLSEKLMQSLGWFGLANLEFKIDSRDNTPKLMEVNPRMWGALHLAVMAGINFPHLLCNLAVKGDIWPMFEYKTDVKYRWVIPGDLLSFSSSLIKYGKFDPGFFRLWEKDTYYAIGSLADPLPVVGQILSGFDFLTSKEMRKFRR